MGGVGGGICTLLAMMSLVIISLREPTCMHCVYLVL